jgi:glycosyltransferase involved in cell wall biosynthesis
VQLLAHERNLGKGAALKDGLAFIHGRGAQWGITLDGDLQHDPAHLPDFLRLANENKHDLIIGARRRNQGGMPWDRRFSNWITSQTLSLVTGRPLRDVQCGYRMIRMTAIEGLTIRSNHYDFETEMLLSLADRGARIGWMPIMTRYHDSESSINRLMDTLRFLKVLFNFIHMKIFKLRR